MQTAAVSVPDLLQTAAVLMPDLLQIAKLPLGQHVMWSVQLPATQAHVWYKLYISCVIPNQLKSVASHLASAHTELCVVGAIP